MRRGVIYHIDVPHRSPMRIRGFEFGDEQGDRCCAIIGSMRGNEVQQTFICSTLVSLLAKIEREGRITGKKSVLVIPCVNPLSMNVQQRFWPGDGSDINRSFPGNRNGRSAERIAASIMGVARLFSYGIQMCSFNQSGEFLPHVRIARQGPISNKSLAIARDFGLPYVIHRDPTPYDTATLNYAWQACGTHAFSLYSRATATIDTSSAKMVAHAVLRFMARRGIIEPPDDADEGHTHASKVLSETELIDVRTERSSGFFVSFACVGERVRKGQRLGAVLDTMDAHTLESLASPVAGQVFFVRSDSLIQQHMVAFRIAPE